MSFISEAIPVIHGVAISTTSLVVQICAISYETQDVNSKENKFSDILLIELIALPIAVYGANGFVAKDYISTEYYNKMKYAYQASIIVFDVMAASYGAVVIMDSVIEKIHIACNKVDSAYEITTCAASFALNSLEGILLGLGVLLSGSIDAYLRSKTIPDSFDKEVTSAIGDLVELLGYAVEPIGYGFGYGLRCSVKLLEYSSDFFGNDHHLG